jgi:hypothetical protein
VLCTRRDILRQALVHELNILEASPLAGGYSELVVESSNKITPAPGPGQYLSAVFAPGEPPVYLPIMQLPAPDRLQVLSCTPRPVARGARMQARIEGEAALPHPDYPKLVVVSGDNALACSILASARLRAQHDLTVFAYFDRAVPFKPAPSQILMPACPPEAIAAIPLLDAWNIPSRLASPLEQSGFYHGDICGLLDYWWQRLSEKDHSQVQMLAFGQHDFLRGLKEWCAARGISLRTAEIPS